MTGEDQNLYISRQKLGQKRTFHKNFFLTQATKRINRTASSLSETERKRKKIKGEISDGFWGHVK